MLKQAGFAVIGAVESAEEAHERVIATSNTEPPFDLMLVDLRLPAMDGVDFCRIVMGTEIKIVGYLVDEPHGTAPVIFGLGF